jgi:membrane protease YdiL (CAAX protease family)
MEKKQLPVELSQREISWGIHYLLLQLLIIGPLFANVLKQFFPKLPLNTELTYNLINIIAVFIIYHRYIGKSIKHSLSQPVKLIVITGISLLVYLLVIPVLEDLVIKLSPTIENFNTNEIEKNMKTNPVATVFGAVFLVPLAEEITYRGLIFGALRQKNRLLAYLVSVLSFSMIHVIGYMERQSWINSLLTILTYIPAALILTVAYDQSGSILPPTLIHTAVNAIVSVNTLLTLT